MKIWPKIVFVTTQVSFELSYATLEGGKNTYNTTYSRRRDGLVRILKDPKQDYLNEVVLGLLWEEMNKTCTLSGNTWYLLNTLVGAKNNLGDIVVFFRDETEGIKRAFRGYLKGIPDDLIPFVRYDGWEVYWPPGSSPSGGPLTPVRMLLSDMSDKYEFDLHLVEDGVLNEPFTTDLGVANADLRYIPYDQVALTENYWNHRYMSVTYIDPGAPSQPLSVSCNLSPSSTDYNKILVNLATDGSGNITSTASQVMAAVNAHASAKTLVKVELAPGSTGAGVVTAMSEETISPRYWDRGY